MVEKSSVKCYVLHLTLLIVIAVILIVIHHVLFVQLWRIHFFFSITRHTQLIFCVCVPCMAERSFLSSLR